MAYPPTLFGWILRDLSIFVVALLTLVGFHNLHIATGFWLISMFTGMLGFVLAYILIYIFHEWGHLTGARLAGAVMPLQPYKSIALGQFDITQHNKRQFIFLSWGGVLGYLSATLLTIVVHESGSLGVAGAGMAIAGLAFSLQALSVDLPQIVKVYNGQDTLTVNHQGTTPALILKRTWQTWIPLSAAILAYNLL